jgi:hypothetical protein
MEDSACIRVAHAVSGAAVPSVWACRPELAKLSLSPLASLWAAVVWPMVLPKELPSVSLLPLDSVLPSASVSVSELARVRR